MAQRGRRRRGSKGFVPNVGEGFDVNPPIGRNNGNPSQRDEIEELRRQVVTLTEMVQRLKPPTEGSEGIELSKFFGSLDLDVFMDWLNTVERVLELWCPKIRSHSKTIPRLAFHLLVFRGSSSNTKVASSLDSRSKTIPRLALRLLVIRAVLVGLKFQLRVLNLLVQAKISRIPGLRGVEIHPKVEGSSVSSVGNQGTNWWSVERLPVIKTRLFLWRTWWSKVVKKIFPSMISQLMERLG
ncbi:hypothetical protein Acr_17g0013430 [Actinidia rufa]|uniref:Uncharacterized protein n=1 Tax=Actinidia rufa TaxID=165716 RepID=A0A7J0G4R0_9ERIC|nr:hypothetical protein Acr_17g0013430 [Actinidia rufa]